MSHSITVLKSKLHNATVTHALKDYEGSVALSPELIKLGNFSMHEQVHLWNITQGTRLITYIMEYDGDEKGIICCLLYTSDAADDSLRVDLGGRRINKIFNT